MDKNLVREHDIRAHINEQRRRWDAFAETNNRTEGRAAEVLYDHTDGDGKWQITTYVYGEYIRTKGAELALAMNEHIATVQRRGGLSVLRNVLAAPATGE